MRLITIIAVEVTALVLLTCFAAWWAVCPTSVNDNITAHIVSNHSFTNHTVCDRVVSEAQQPLSVKALLPGTDLSENFRLVQNDAEQLVEISRISGDIHRRYFVQGNITAAIPTTNRNTAWVLSRIESKLRTLSTLRSLEVHANFTIGPL
ncbi:hypothetical protein B0A55_05066 [Friedmanniomyces simplex]|uniref:Uncharacterized protein n=1 Tax=Friedmanniomyces simplex TaxID=329884 RepID=A0A4V5NGC7_9PEZI|nr:hypothetical protein B0A55_05066 [Friedmanniomyces simplex]